MKHPYQFDRYAGSVIGGKPQDFDAIEVHGVRHDPSSGEESIVRDNERPEFFSVYLHYKEGNSQGGEGIQCAGDFTRRSDAQCYAVELGVEHNWPVHDYSTELNPMRAWEKMTDRALLEGACLDDIDHAAAHVQNIAGITAGDIADQALHHLREIWPKMKASARVEAFEQWRDLEESADISYEPDAPQHLETTVILAALRTLQENVNVLSDGVVDILGDDNILVETAEQRTQLVEDIDAICERVNVVRDDSTALTLLRKLLPFAQTRAEDMTESAVDVEAKVAAADAWETVNAAHAMLGTSA